jgi:ubiquinone/menaquinone biosynthesis C-methylase UbiE
MDRHQLFGFTDVDRTADPAYFIRFLDDANADASFQAYKRLTFALLEVRPGRQVLDVGCGTGEDARALAALVAPGGRVLAEDSSEVMIDTARQRAEGCGLPVEFRQGDVHHLDFADGTFDACRCDRAFMHLQDPAGALREMVRVAKPGGRVLVYEVDFEALTVDLPDRAVTRRVVNTWCDGFRNGWLGRQVPGLFHEVGLQDVTTHPATLRLRYPLAMQMVGPATVERASAAGVISAAEGQAWLREAQAREEAGRFFATLTGFIVVGRKGGAGAR